MEGRIVVITGASSGIGAAGATELARRGATVVPVGRDERRLAKVARAVGTEGVGADLASLAEVRRLADELLARHGRIHVLVNNAGVMPRRRQLTEDGHELTLAVNHLAPFLLTNLLLDRLRESAPARVVTTSSVAHTGGLIDLDDLQLERRWAGMRAYSGSKLANVLFTRELARRLRGSGVVANCFHPGVIRTRLTRRANPLLRIGALVAAPVLGSPRTGAETLVWLASSPEAAEVSGRYFEGCAPGRASAQSQDAALAAALWDRSAELVGLRASPA
ncbi:MAG TPA: SDR family oxidoreductase [Thermoleophilaceae bacterium]|nr:SDR family oxidoreductase [Thermoleophilaceae bacterium]